LYLRCPKVPERVVDQKTADTAYKNVQKQKKADRDRFLRSLRHPTAITLALRLSLKQRAVESKGGCCSLCEYSKCLKALEFHHIESHNKSFNISTFIGEKINEAFQRGGAITAQDIENIWDSLAVELRKCVLLCANCHREVEEGIVDLKGENGS
jgi:hypothetical protein